MLEFQRAQLEWRYMYWLSCWDQSLDRASSAMNSSHRQSSGISSPLLTQLLNKWVVQRRTVLAVQGSIGSAIHKELHYTRSLHDLPELALSVRSLYLNHSEMWPFSWPLPSTLCLLFHLCCVPGSQTSNLPLRHEPASGLWCHLAGYMPTDWIQVLRQNIHGSRWTACLCLLCSQGCCLQVEEGLQKQVLTWSKPTPQRPAHAYWAQPSLWIVRR